MGSLFRRFLGAVVTAGVFFVAVEAAGPRMADATLELYQPNPAVGASFIGRGGTSSDGLGQLAPGGTLQAEVPAGSTVQFALLYAATVFGGDTTSLVFNGQTVTLTPLPNVENPGLFSTTRADVTSIVSAVVGSGGGTFNFTVDSDPTSPLLNGVALVVVYANNSLPERSISIFDGGLGFGPQTTVFTFGRAVNKSRPGFQATLAFGIQHGFQGPGGGAEVPGTNICGTDQGQYSIVDINGARLSSCAGNYDDGWGLNGALVTVGGVGDSLDIPSDPFQTAGDGALPRVTDDELYDISSFVNDGDTSLTLTTSNPSNDDSIFLAIVTITGEATVEVPVERKVIFVAGLHSGFECNVVDSGTLKWWGLWFFLRDNLPSLALNTNDDLFIFSYADNYDCPGATPLSRARYTGADTCDSINRNGDRNGDGGYSAVFDRWFDRLAAQYPNAQFDIVTHSMGGVVAGYWAAAVAARSDLGRVHSIVTLDSPLQGRLGAAWLPFLPGPCGANDPALIDLDPISLTIKRLNSPAKPADCGTHTKEANVTKDEAILTIRNDADQVVPETRACIPGATDFLVDDACGFPNHDCVFTNNAVRQRVIQWLSN